MSTKINDDVHYNAIRKALANGNAAVMIGAGFSRNAENGDQLAMWYDVAKELWRELNPTESDLDNFSAGMVTQLGEQYARVFSKPALEELLKRLIPDDRVRPGALHNKLLQLPWSELFTTNYDTLLERAADEIVERAHYTVICREDIPQSKILGRRRIVKLHGSFPSQRPFIFTEDDYRRYPELFSPFVNLVRQSLLENVFCLVGFSGDDPNFLHWIGWVRDMLDKHALPIYLFVTRAPSLGQRTLLEARQVTPVVLPLPDGIEEFDYYSRFDALFRLLAKPLDEEESEWGDLPPLDQILRLPHQDVEERQRRLLSTYSHVGALRKNYPGWIIAPTSVRRRFRRTIDAIPRFLYGIDLQNKLAQDTPHVGVTILAEYAWHQEVMLQCMDDSLALFALNLIKLTSSHLLTKLDKQNADLKKLGVESTIEFQRRWRDLGLSLLRWARQELRRDEFNSLKELLISALPKDLHLHDEISHESILLALYEGDRDIAHRLLGEWNIRSSDSYMHVRKGILLGELGNQEIGIAVSLKGLQQLRRNQRLHANSTPYLSQEAWACLAISHLQKSRSWSLPSTEGYLDDELLSEQLDRRLADLAAKGFDSRRELQQLTAALNAETPPPSQPKNHIPQFELGSYSVTEQLTSPQELADKIYAAFAWLTMSDRVALVPRIGNTTFDIGSFAQAAWWVQYADSMQRVLSVIMRTLNRDMLKPRNPNQLLHKAGWLSRYQVARTEESLALQICTRSLSLVERMLSNTAIDNDLQRVTGFHMDVFARLAIRISDTKKIYSFTERVIALHHQPLLWRLSQLWKDLARALSRCFESLPPDDRAKIAPLIAKIPELNTLPKIDIHHKDDWICLHLLKRRTNDLTTLKNSHEISATIDSLIAKLQPEKQNQQPSHPQKSVWLKDTWQRLLWLNDWGLIGDNQKDKIRKILVNSEDWPLIPGRYPWAALFWLENNVTDFDKKFRHWIISQELAYFSTESHITIRPQNSIKSWSPDASNELLQCWIYSLDREPWPKEDILAGFELVKRWWDSEWHDLREELPNIEELREALNQRLELLDIIIALLIKDDCMLEPINESNIEIWLNSVIDQGSEFGSKFWRLRLSKSLNQNNKQEINKIEKELIENLTDSDIPKINKSSSAISYWATQPSLDQKENPELLINTLSGIISTRRMPALPWALSLMSEIAHHKINWITSNSYSLIELGLEKMLQELSYENRPLGSGIPDDNIPTLRWHCARLSVELKNSKKFDKSNTISSWIELTNCDPLPELRFLENPTRKQI